MAGYGFAAQAIDTSRRSITPSDTTGDHWVLAKFSRVLALALGKKSWAKPAQTSVHFGDVIERVKQAQGEEPSQAVRDGQRDINQRSFDETGNG